MSYYKDHKIDIWKYRGFLVIIVLLMAFMLGGSKPAYATWLWQYPPNMVTPDSGKRNNVFYVGDPLVFVLHGSATVKYEVRDYWGNIVDQGKAVTPLTIAQQPPGWYKLYLHGAVQQSPWGDSVGGTMFCVFRNNANFPLEPPVTAPNNSSVGDGDEVVRGVTGMGPQRHYVADAANPTASFALLDQSIGQDKTYYLPYDAARNRVLLVAFPNGATNLAGVSQIVTRYQNSVQYWEPRNEPNFAMSAADYVNNELKPFYTTIKSINPNLKVIGPAIVTIGPYGLSWIESFLKAGGANYMDALSFHGYNNENGDLALTRKSLDALQALLTKYGIGNIEKWQTEQGYFAACYGAYEPRLQGRWTMLQMMAYEQYGIPKEHNHLWYDKSHGFWDYPTWWQNEDGPYSIGSLNPAAPLMRVWSEELYGTNFAKAYDFGALGNKLLLGSLFSGTGKQVAAFMSAGSTDSQLTLSVSAGSSVHVVSAFGVAQDIPVINGEVVLTVPEIPVYVELASGQTVTPVPIDWGPDLALAPGTSALASGTGVYPTDPSVPNSISKIINGVLENWYWGQTSSDHPWMDNTPTGQPTWVEITLPSPTLINHVVIYAGVPWQNDGSLLDYELQYDSNGQWVTLSHVQEPTNVTKFFTPTVHTTVDSFYSDRNIFTHTFPEVLTQKIRILVHDETWGGGATSDVVAAGGQTGPHQVELREVEIYHTNNTVTAQVGTGLIGEYFTDTNFANRTATQVDPSINMDWTGASPAQGIVAGNPFTARWTGQIQPLFSGTYTFTTEASDGVRLWVDDQQIINDWQAHSTTSDSGTIALTAGIKYDIQLDYESLTTPTPNVYLLWSSPDQIQQIVPQAQLFPSLLTGAPSAGKIRFFPRSHFTIQMLNGRFQGSNDGINYGDLCTISTQPTDGVWTEIPVSIDPSNFRYLRYLSPGGSYGDVAEIEFYSGTTKLTGTPFGTTGSFQNSGNTFLKVFDGDTTTFFDGAAPSGNVVGIDRGTGNTGGGGGGGGIVVPTGSLRYVPRTTCAGRMVGGQFQGSNDGVTYTTFYSVSQAPIEQAWTTVPLTIDPGQYRYLRYMSPNGSYGNIADFELYSGTTKLTGTLFGSPGSYQNSGSTFSNVFDDNLATYFDAPTPNGNFAGFDRGAGTGSGVVVVPPVAVGAIKYVPRTTCAGRMVGGIFQGSKDGITYTAIYTITQVPIEKTWTVAPIAVDPSQYRYLRYLSPNGSYGNVAEIEFDSGSTKLTGTAYGSPGSYQNSGNTFGKVFDGDITTYFDAPTANGNFAGIDRGAAAAAP